VSALAYAAGRQEDAASRCAGGEASIAPVWDAAARARVADAFRRSSRPYAGDTFRRVDAALLAVQGEWALAHRDACEATHLRGEQSEAILDRRMTCLARARQRLTILVGALADADAEAVDRALHATLAVDVGGCSDVAALAKVAPPPRDPAVAAEVDAIRTEAARTAVLYDVGRVQDSLAAGRALVPRARAVADAPALADALYAAERPEAAAGELPVALALLYQAADAAQTVGDDRLYALILCELGFVLGRRLEKVGEGELALRLARSAVERAGNPPELTAKLLAEEARLAHVKGDYQGALRRFSVVLAIQLARLGPDHPEVATALADVAGEQGFLGELTQARATYEQALAALVRALGPDHPRVGTLLGNFGLLLRDRGDYAAAAEASGRAIDIYEGVYGPDHLKLATLLGTFALVRLDQGRHADAGTLAQRELAIKIRHLGPDHPGTAYPIDVLAATTLAEGRLDDALTHARRALAIRERNFGPEHVLLTGTLQTMSRIYSRMGHGRRARESIERALRLQEKLLGEDHPDLVSSLVPYAQALASARRHADAARSFQRAIAIAESALGAEHPDLGVALDGHAGHLLARGRPREAIPVAERALIILDRVGASVENRASARFHLAQALWAGGVDRRRAVQVAREAEALLAPLPFAWARTELKKWLDARR
jgi:serine/threonine-protein kinase